MTEPHSPEPAPSWRKELDALRADAAELAAARVELARLELNAAAQLGKRLGTMAACSGLLLTSGLTLLMTQLARFMARQFGGSPAAWTAAFAFLAILVGLLGFGWISRRLHRDFRPLSQTLEELREDARWLREWLGSTEQEN
ncbi:MAG: phage holin family protein [Planctomycetales bacterium]|nr:phage holin family protein [Planctomycetales bacterium]